MWNTMLDHASRRRTGPIPRITWLALAAGGLGLPAAVLLEAGWGTPSILAVAMGLLVSVHCGRTARLVRRLEEAVDRLTEQQRVKVDLMAIVSHELRTPLTSMQGTIKTLRRSRSRIDPETEASLLEAADRQSDRLRRLIENLLIVGRIESRQVAADVTDVTLGRLIERVGEDVAGPDVAPRLRVVLDPRLPRIETDEGKLHRIVLNLVENALKYSPSSSPVVVRAVPQGAGVVLSVEDRGEGVPVAVRDRIFDRFFQVDQSATRSVGGTGLGLYICKQLAETLGGYLWLDRSDRSGSVFSLWLPLRPIGGPVPEALRLPRGAGVRPGVIRRAS